MNLSKHLSFFDPINQVNAPIHIIGCGAVGSTLAEMLTRMGCSNLHLYDFDIVTEHNVANQMFYHEQVNMLKTDALTVILKSINPNVEVKQHDGGYKEQRLSGYVFLCVDDIDLRRQIATAQEFNPHIKAMFDFRLQLTCGQVYTALWNPKEIKGFLDTMQFSHEEAAEATPTNACGTVLGIIPTCRIAVSFGIANFVNIVKGQPHKRMIIADVFSGLVDAF